MFPLALYALLAWAGHLVALYAIMAYDWHGFLLAVALDLPWQAGLLNWSWHEHILPRYRQWQDARRRPARLGEPPVWPRY